MKEKEQKELLNKMTKEEILYCVQQEWRNFQDSELKYYFKELDNISLKFIKESEKIKSKIDEKINRIANLLDYCLPDEYSDYESEEHSKARELFVYKWRKLDPYAYDEED